MGNLTEPSDLAMLRRNAAEFRKGKAARICGAQYQRKEGHKIYRRVPLCLWLRSDLCLNEIKILTKARERNIEQHKAV